MNFSSMALIQSYITRGSQAFCILPLTIFQSINYCFRVLYLIFLSKCSIMCLHAFWRISQIFYSEYFFWAVLTVFNIIVIWLQRRIKIFLKKESSISIIMQFWVFIIYYLSFCLIIVTKSVFLQSTQKKLLL